MRSQYQQGRRRIQSKARKFCGENGAHLLKLAGDVRRGMIIAVREDTEMRTADFYPRLFFGRGHEPQHEDKCEGCEIVTVAHVNCIMRRNRDARQSIFADW